MESEHIKASNENVQKAPEMKPEDQTACIEEAKNQELSSPSLSPMEVHKGPDTNPFTKLELNERGSSSSPEPTEMRSPAIQVMGQPPGYDPNRIPASVFSTKNNADWSATSNESLFSIHMGNNSFSRDYAILFGKSGELPKLEDWNGTPTNPFMMSTELPRLDEWNSSPQLPKSSESSGLPPVMEDPVREEISSLQSIEDMSPGKQNLCVSLPKKPPIPETNSSSFTNPTSIPSPNRFSDVSVHSGSSFAFPVLGNQDSGKNESVKVVPERLEKADKGEQQPHSQNQAQASTEAPAGASGARWFSCFSCWPRFC